MDAMKRCPYCVEKMQDMAVVCPHCGRDVPRLDELVEGELVTGAPVKLSAGKRVGMILAALVLLALAFSGWLYVFYYMKAAGTNFQTLEATRSAQSVDLALSQSERTAIAGTQQVQQTQVADSVSLLATIDAMRATEQAKDIQATAEMQTALSHQTKLCKEGLGLTWDYTNNETISDQLRTFVENLGGKTTKATYILPWNVPYLAIHQFTNKYVFWFIVYFQKDGTDFKNSIYWVEMNCFLDYQ
jgi:hypothetical protein